MLRQAIRHWQCEGMVQGAPARQGRELINVRSRQGACTFGIGWIAARLLTGGDRGKRTSVHEVRDGSYAPNLGHWSNKAALLKADIKAVPRMVAATGNDLGWLLYEAQFSFGSPRGVAQRYALIEVGGND
jgi:hypothetical protein